MRIDGRMHTMKPTGLVALVFLCACGNPGESGDACASEDDCADGFECQIEDDDADGDGVGELVGECKEEGAHDDD